MTFSWVVQTVVHLRQFYELCVTKMLSDTSKKFIQDNKLGDRLRLSALLNFYMEN